MRNIPGPLAAHIAGDVTQLCRLWRVTRKDGFVLRFTDLDDDVTFGVDENDEPAVYRADVGFSSSAIFLSSETTNQGLTLTVFCDATAFAVEDLENGLYDGAEATISVICWSDPTLGEFPLFVGKLGKKIIKDRRIAEINVNPTDDGSRFIQTEVFSSRCRADLGDTRCGVDIEALAIDITIETTSGQGRQINSEDVTGDVDAWAEGLIVFTSGKNNGQAVEIATSSEGTLYLYTTPMFRPQVGDTARVYPGCDKSLETCKVDYNNVINFRGEPFVPGDELDNEET